MKPEPFCAALHGQTLGGLRGRRAVWFDPHAKLAEIEAQPPALGATSQLSQLSLLPKTETARAIATGYVQIFHSHNLNDRVLAPQPTRDPPAKAYPRHFHILMEKSREHNQKLQNSRIPARKGKAVQAQLHVSNEISMADGSNTSRNLFFQARQKWRNLSTWKLNLAQSQKQESTARKRELHHWIRPTDQTRDQLHGLEASGKHS